MKSSKLTNNSSNSLLIQNKGFSIISLELLSNSVLMVYRDYCFTLMTQNGFWLWSEKILECSDPSILNPSITHQYQAKQYCRCWSQVDLYKSEVVLNELTIWDFSWRYLFLVWKSEAKNDPKGCVFIRETGRWPSVEWFYFNK
jgi:hypothetical protein